MRFTTILHQTTNGMASSHAENRSPGSPRPKVA
jgi:hypothetical protein